MGLPGAAKKETTSDGAYVGDGDDTPMFIPVRVLLCLLLARAVCF